jgi:putative ABC transport system permease protein
VIGTTPDFFTHFQYGPKRPLTFADGKSFAHHHQVVLGAWVAKQLGYKVGKPITVSHGLGETSFAPHDQHGFTVSGILKPTGTPVDRALYVDLSAIEWLHQDQIDGFAPSRPEAITAMFIGLKSKLSIFEWQRWLNTYPQEALLAILPSLTLYEMWNLVSMAEKTLMVISFLVFVTAMFGLLIALLSSMRERRYEMAVLRSQGARPRSIAGLFIIETALISAVAIVVGLLMLHVSLRLAAPWLQQNYGLFMTHHWIHPTEWTWLGLLWGASLVFSLLPSVIAYRQSLQNGLQS